jgi:hypothetical protein
MLAQKKERLERISDSLQSTPKFSPDFTRQLELTRKNKFNSQINDDGYSPYIYSIAISPSNRIQLKIHPYLENHGKSSKQDDAVISSLERDYKICSVSGIVPKKDSSLASLPNCNARITPYSPELDFQQWAEDYSLVPMHLVKNRHPTLPRAKQFTRRARLTILDAAGALEKEGYLPSDFQFFTGTLPGSSPAACEYFARYSRMFLNSMKQGLRRLGLDLTFNCWEWQLRKKANLVPALHLHMVVVCEDKQLASRLPEILEDMWFRLLDHYSAQSGVDLFEKHERVGGGRWTRSQLQKLSEELNFQTCKTVTCTKSVGAYLSKYVGKGSLAGDKDFQDRFKKHSVPLYYPSSWWSVSDSIRALIKKHSSAASFIATMNQCMDAYHSLTSIFEDEDYDLIELALPVFIPEWSAGNRFYQNFYCKSEKFDQCVELVSTYSDTCEDGNYESQRFVYIPQTATSVRMKIEADDSGRLLSSLIRSLPFYCLNKGQVDWNNSLVIEAAFNVINSEIDYPTLESLQDRISWQNHLDSLSDQERFDRIQIKLNPYLG